MDFFQREDINGREAAYYLAFLVFYRSNTMPYPMFFARNRSISPAVVPRRAA